MLLALDWEKDRLTLELNKAQQPIIEQDKRQAICRSMITQCTISL